MTRPLVLIVCVHLCSYVTVKARPKNAHKKYRYIYIYIYIFLYQYLYLFLYQY